MRFRLSQPCILHPLRHRFESIAKKKGFRKPPNLRCHFIICTITNASFRFGWIRINFNLQVDKGKNRRRKRKHGNTIRD